MYFLQTQENELRKMTLMWSSVHKGEALEVVATLLRLLVHADLEVQWITRKMRACDLLVDEELGVVES